MPHQAGFVRFVFFPRAQPLAFAVLFLLWAARSVAAGVAFDIPAQSAPDAFLVFKKQSGAEVLFNEELKRVTTNAVKGEMEPVEALQKLLNETGYFAKTGGPKNFIVMKEVAGRGIVKGTIVKPTLGSSAGIRILVRETGQQAVTSGRGDFVLVNMEAGIYTLIASAEGMQRMHITDVNVRGGREITLSPETMRTASDVTELEPFIVRGRANEVTEFEKYVVEGQRQKPFVAGNMDIPRTINDAQPYYIFSSEMIDSSGATNIEDFLKQRLTMNTVAQTNGQISGANVAGNTSNINLRGLGSDKTLILVNGRRLAGVAISDDTFQPDLNGIPLSSIQRIEVLPSSASGIYGGSAIGGVVNVILKRDYQGGEVRATYDNTWDTDSPRRSVAVNYGLSLEGGKTHLSLSASWSDATPLLLQERADIFRENMKSIQSRSPQFFYSNFNPWLGSLPNISNAAFGPTTLILKNGNVALGSNLTHIPAGTSASTSASALSAGLIANAGRWNFDFPASTQAPTGLLRQFGGTPEIRSFRSVLRRQMLPRVELFAEFSYNENRSEAVYNPLGGSSSLYVAATVQSNPFTTPVYVRVPDAGQIPTTSNSQGRSATIGSLAKLPWGWTGALDYTWSESRMQSLSYNQDLTAFNADLASGALNPFVDTLLNPLNGQKYIFPVQLRSQNELHLFTLRGSGALPALPWGQPNLTVGLEHRISKTPERSQRFDYPISVASSVEYIYYARESATDSGYAEATVPLIKSAWLPGLHALDLQLSGRSERYEVDTGTNFRLNYFKRTPALTSYGTPTLNGQPYFSTSSYSSSNYTMGLLYQPVKTVTLRASRATAFLPPSPSQLITNPERTVMILGNDPRTGARNQSIEVIGGGNPDLKPQTSKSLNAGIIWEPLSALRLNAEYYRIEQFNSIGALGAQAIVDQENVFPTRVTRDSNGRIVVVDATLVNLYHRESEGWDLSVSYSLRTPIGRFTLTAMESIALHLKNQYEQTQPEYESEGFHPSDSAGVAKYKTNGNLNWEWRRWSAGWTVRHFSAYKQYGAEGGPYSKQYMNGAAYTYYINAAGSDTVQAQTYHDLFFGYAFGERKLVNRETTLKAFGNKLLDGLTVQLGVRNVFDDVPPLDTYFANNYYVSPYGDMRLRSYWLNVRKSF